MGRGAWWHKNGDNCSCKTKKKSVTFLYTNNELSERETRKTIPLTIVTTKKEVPRNKFYQGGKRPVLRKLEDTEEIEEDTNKWKHISCSWIVIINIIKMCIKPKTIYRLNTIPIKIPMAYFTNLEQIFQNFL